MDGFRRMLGVCSHSADHIPVSALQVRVGRASLFGERPTLECRATVKLLPDFQNRKVFISPIEVDIHVYLVGRRASRNHARYCSIFSRCPAGACRWQVEYSSLPGFAPQRTSAQSLGL